MSEVEQDEDQFVTHRFYLPLSSTSSFPQAFMVSLGALPVQINFICPVKYRQQLQKPLQAQSRHTPKYGWFLFQFAIADHQYTIPKY